MGLPPAVARLFSANDTQQLSAPRARRIEKPRQFLAEDAGATRAENRTGGCPAGVLESLFPKPRPAYHIIHQRKGLGSLGRARYTAVAEHCGGMIAREAKALLPSACVWLKQSGKKSPIHYQQIVESAVRCPDPFLSVNSPWIVRRLAPDCSRIELASLSRNADEARLLRAMGWETANIHLRTAGAGKAIRKDLKSRKPGWLRIAAKKMAEGGDRRLGSVAKIK